MRSLNWKELEIDILVDLFAGLLIAVGVYNFALNANFPVEGFSGIAIILYHLFDLPVGISLFVLNIPAAIFSYKLLGKTFFLNAHWFWLSGNPICQRFATHYIAIQNLPFES